MLNPKAALFFVAPVPQFVSVGASMGDTLVLSLIAPAGTVAWFMVVASVVGVLRRVFARSAVRRSVDGLTGAALIALGVDLATSSRP